MSDSVTLCSTPGSSVHGILQTTILEWIALPFSRGSSWPRDPALRVASLTLSHHAAAAAAKSLQSCPTLCNPIDSSPPGSPVPGILQARTLEWVAISFSNAWKWKVKMKSLSHVWLWATSRTAAHQAPPPMRFSRQDYWSGVPLPSLTVSMGVYLIDLSPFHPAQFYKSLSSNQGNKQKRLA